jgi:hypothetical protein
MAYLTLSLAMLPVCHVTSYPDEVLGFYLAKLGAVGRSRVVAEVQ